MQTQTIGVIASNLLHPFTAELLRMIYASCHTRGYHLWVGNAEHSQEGWALSDILAADFAENDLPAISIMKAALMCGVRVPTDLSVVGFDDIAFAALCTPGLTTIRQPLEAMGRYAAATLLDGIGGTEHVDGIGGTERAPLPAALVEQAGPNSVFRPTLIPRESTGPPAH